MWSILVLVSVLGCALAVPPVSRSRAEIERFKNFLEQSRTDNGIRLESRMLANPKSTPWANSGKFQGDILLNDIQAEVLLQQFTEGRNAYIVPNTKWPQNTIIYQFNNEFTQAQRNAIEMAMWQIESNTCIRFRQRYWWESNYVLITGRPDGCYASVGYWNQMGIHTLNLAKANPGHGCFMNTVIIHEWLHVVGFMHMQSTHNRDSYVHILWHNIFPGMEYNFEKYSSNIVDNMGLPYEYASNMHYDRYGFSINGQPTMLPIYNDNGLMGQTSFVTSWDWLRANRHYNCPGAWSAIVEEVPLEKLEDSPQDISEDTPQDISEDTPQDISEDTPQEKSDK